MMEIIRRRTSVPQGGDGDLSKGSSLLAMRKHSWSFGTLIAGPDRGRVHGAPSRTLVPSLVEAGRHAGRTRVKYRGHNIQLHLFTRDFFITMINLKTTTIAAVVFVVYLAFFFLFSIPYYLIIRFYPGCIYGATTYVEAWIFSVITQMTIGYGNTGPQQCWAASWVICVQALINVLLEAVTLGIIFSRISHPKQRGRSIFISDKAIVARRDGILKFMFRVADIRNTQVVEPKIRAFLYTWGEGRTTAEGERIPVRCEELDIGYIDGMLILPLIIEHTVDERSPLCGHTHDSLMALSAEIVVTFEGTTEFGNPFMSRRSYLPHDVYWGYQFAPIIGRPLGEDTGYTISLEQFHDVEPQVGLPPLPPSQLSHLVVNRAKRTVPYPLLGENTMVLSDVVCMAPNAQGRMCLFCRVADTYPNQMLEITVRMFLYRWVSPSAAEDPSRPTPTYTQYQLDCGYETGADRLYLRLPLEVVHDITDDSPVAGWLRPDGLLQDSDSELVVVINGYLGLNGQNRMRQRTYLVGHHVRYGYRFQPIVRHPSQSRDHKPRVRWNHFHDVYPVPGMPVLLPRSGDVPNGGQAAPESHGGRRSQHDAAGAARSCMDGAGPTPSGGPSTAAKAVAVTLDMQQPLQAYPQQEFDDRNDYTVAPIDLQRYAATTEDMDVTLPKLQDMGRRSPLPDFSAAAAAAAAIEAGLPDVEGAAGSAPSSPSRRGPPGEALSSWKRLLGRQRSGMGAGEGSGSGGDEPAWRRSWRERQAAAVALESSSPEERFSVLFPEVVSYAATTTDAGDSLPHPAALHPTLPGPDRFRAPTDEEIAAQARNEVTVLPLDLQRYAATMLGDSSTFMAPALQRRPLLPTRSHFSISTRTAPLPLSDHQQQGTAVGPGARGGGRNVAGEDGLIYKGPQLESKQQGSSDAANAGEELYAGERPEHEPSEGLQQPQSRQGPVPQAGEKQQAAPPVLASIGPEAASAAIRQTSPTVPSAQQQHWDEDANRASDAISDAQKAEERLDRQGSVSSEKVKSQPPATAVDVGVGEEDMLAPPLRRGPSIAELMASQPELLLSPPEEEPFDVEQRHSGPIHFTKSESWKRDRALKNLFTADDVPPFISEAEQEGEEPAGI